MFRKVLYMFLALGVCSCVEQIKISGPSDFTPKLVISGVLATDRDNQEIVVSRSSFPEEPEFSGVSGCEVRVEDYLGNVYFFHEDLANNGHYKSMISMNDYKAGAQFKLMVTTPDGKQYVSESEELFSCPPVGQLHYSLVSKPTSNPETNEDGLQFYVDFEGNADDPNFYRWEIEETYEYHSTWPIIKYMTATGTVTLKQPDYSLFTCYKTEKVPGIFVLSTRGLTQNSYRSFPLHFVNDHSQRLMFRYSILVKQYSLSKSAYTFLSDLRKNNIDGVDIFGRQPIRTKGNLRNVNDSGEEVLGYFGVSSVTSRRLMVPAVTELSFASYAFCHVTRPVPGTSLPDERPLYWAPGVDETGEFFWGYSDTDCFICTLHGGTTEKPFYWDSK